MNAADFAMMSDPDRNPKFSRRWEEPVRRRPPLVAPPPALDTLAVLVSEDWRSARVVREGAA